MVGMYNKFSDKLLTLCKAYAIMYLVLKKTNKKRKDTKMKEMTYKTDCVPIRQNSTLMSYPY